MKKIGSVNYKYDIFISYSAKDREFVISLSRDLRRKGFNIWFDQADIKVGDSFAQAIDKAMKESRFILIIMSPDYFQSNWTQQEWRYGLASEEMGEAGVRLIPVLYKDCEIPAILKSKLWVDFTDEKQYNVILNRLVSDLRALASEKYNTTTTEVPKPGEQVEELDSNSLLELKQILKDAVEVFRAKPESKIIGNSKSEEFTIDKTLCFIIMPFSVEALNIVYEDFVKPVVIEKCNLKSIRGDDVFGSNVVMDDITKSIQNARLIIADLTGRNPNVFYEVGIAHALNKQVLLMTQSIDDVPFDLRHRRALVYEYSPRGCKKLEKDLFENIQDMLSQQ